MSAFCVPTPIIIPLTISNFGESKNIDNQTKLEIMCESELPGIDVFYTLDGSKPQPYAGIIQGNKTIKYTKPFCLSSGKVTIRATAIHSQLHNMISSVVTKTYYVTEVEKKETKNKSKFKKELSFSKKQLISKDTQIQITETAVDTVITEETESVQNSHSVEVDEEIVEELENAKFESGNYFSVIPNRPSRANLHLNFSRIQVVSEETDEKVSSNSPDEVLATTSAEIVEIYDEDEYAPNHINEISTVETKSILQKCVPFDMSFQHCFLCKKISSISSRFCDECGEKLHKVCSSCKELNPSIAKFCQFCGDHFKNGDGNKETEEALKKYESLGVQVKPKLVSSSTNISVLPTLDKAVQTVPVTERKVVKSDCSVNYPPCTPGRGYWRQQLDYICNHLKAHANNNLIFQKAVGAPSLGKFLSAKVEDSEGTVAIYVSFESLPIEKR